MYQRLWKESHGAVCSISFYSENGIKITSLTGFKVNNSIVTDEYIYKIVRCQEVVFQFVRDDGYTSRLSMKMPFTEFTQRINRLVEFENEGFAIIALDGIGAHGIPSLTFETEPCYGIGESIAVIGYQVEQDNLSIKTGIISSFFKASDGRRFIQFDAAVKQGNAGSPLLNANTGKVIGVVGHRLASFTKSYEAFKKIIDENLRLLKKSEGKMNIMEIDPIQVLVANQNQLKQISKEFYKSATMSFGYSHEIISVQNYREASLPVSAMPTLSKEVNMDR
jgi:hypothetical protein